MRALLRSPNRLVALVLGVAFAGYAVFAVVTARPLMCGLLAIAAAGLVMGAVFGIASARIANIIVGTAWLALGYAGLFLVGTDGNIVGLTALDEVALFAAATLQLAVGLGARRDVATRPRPDTEPEAP